MFVRTLKLVGYIYITLTIFSDMTNSSIILINNLYPTTYNITYFISFESGQS